MLNDAKFDERGGSDWTPAGKTLSLSKGIEFTFTVSFKSEFATGEAAQKDFREVDELLKALLPGMHVQLNPLMPWEHTVNNQMLIAWQRSHRSYRYS